MGLVSCLIRAGRFAGFDLVLPSHSVDSSTPAGSHRPFAQIHSNTPVKLTLAFHDHFPTQSNPPARKSRLQGLPYVHSAVALFRSANLATADDFRWGRVVPRAHAPATARRRRIAESDVRQPPTRASSSSWNGRPSHLDMWDPKPDALAEVKGEFKPIQTSCSAIHFGEHLPKFAQQMRRCTLIRSAHHSVNNAHAAAVYCADRPRPRRNRRRGLTAGRLPGALGR